MAHDNDDTMKPVTRGELRDELKAFEQSIDAKMDRKLEIWAGAIMARIDEKLATKLDAKQFSLELAHQVRSIMEHMTDLIRGLDDKYKDLPARVTRLERKVFPKRR